MSCKVNKERKKRKRKSAAATEVDASGYSATNDDVVQAAFPPVISDETCKSRLSEFRRMLSRAAVLLLVCAVCGEFVDRERFAKPMTPSFFCALTGSLATFCTRVWGSLRALTTTTGQMSYVTWCSTNTASRGATTWSRGAAGARVSGLVQEVQGVVATAEDARVCLVYMVAW